MTRQKVDEVGPCKWNRLSVNGVRLYPLEDSVSLIYKIPLIVVFFIHFVLQLSYTWNQN